MNACPFYAARIVAVDADIVLCPYTYLLDPLVRAGLGISLKGTCIIIDEAHNLDDAARSAASAELSLEALEELAQHLQSAVTPLSGPDDPARPLLFVIESLIRWIKDNSMQIPSIEYERFAGVWSGEEAIAILHAAGARVETLSLLQNCHTKVAPAPDLEEGIPILTGSSAATLNRM